MAFKQVSNILQAADKPGLGVVDNSIDMETDADDLAASDNKNYDCVGATDDGTSDYSDDDTYDYDDVYAFENERHVIQKKIAHLKTFNLSHLSRTDLGICCPPGQLCCFRCAYNFGFNRTFSDTKLIERVASGLKPVGEIAQYIPNEKLRRRIIEAGLEILVDGVKNRWGATIYCFSRTDIANKFFSDFINLDTLRDITGLDLTDVQIRNHATDPAFYNELDNIVARGVVFGYPIWSSIAVFFKENQCNDALGPDDCEDDDCEDKDNSDGVSEPDDSENDDVNECAAHAGLVETPITRQ